MLIELRIGAGKWKLKGIMHKTASYCKLSRGKAQRIPHLTLYYGALASAKQVEKIKECMESIGKKYIYLPFLIDGFSYMNGDKGKVVYFNVIPSKFFEDFVYELRNGLAEIFPSYKSFDKDPVFLSQRLYR